MCLSGCLVRASGRLILVGISSMAHGRRLVGGMLLAYSGSSTGGTHPHDHISRRDSGGPQVRPARPARRSHRRRHAGVVRAGQRLGHRGDRCHHAQRRRPHCPRATADHLHSLHLPAVRRPRQRSMANLLPTLAIGARRPQPPLALRSRRAAAAVRAAGPRSSTSRPTQPTRYRPSRQPSPSLPPTR